MRSMSGRSSRSTLMLTNSSFRTACRGLVLEALLFQHVAPVARQIAHAQVNRLLFRARFGERLLAPRVPIDRVVRVLAQVRTRLVGETVGVLGAAVGVEMAVLHHGSPGGIVYSIPASLPGSAVPCDLCACRTRHGRTRTAAEAGRGTTPEQRTSVGVQQRDRHRQHTALAPIEPGALAQLRSHRDAFLGYVCVNPHALICARILSRDIERPVDAALLEQRLRTALSLRERVRTAPYYRWVFGESDLLPGLVLDRYGDVIVGQIATAGMEALRDEVAAAVRTRARTRDALLEERLGRARAGTAAQGGAGRIRQRARRSSRCTSADCTFAVPLATAQKTGWFFDQTGNRERLQRYVPSGARVLDVCCYAGAWALATLKYGAGSALCVDSSQPALDCARANASRNGLALQLMREDAFDASAAAGRAGRALRAGDPRPAGVHQAQEGHRARTGGLPQTQSARARRCSRMRACWSPVRAPITSRPRNSSTPFRAPHATAGASCRSWKAGGQSPDHPLHPAIPETRYLKAFFCRVTREVG